MHVTVTSSARNAERYAERCTRSVREQTLRDFTHIYIDADSTDETFARARAGGDTRLDLRRAESRKSALDNLLSVWRALPADEIVVWLDGDDALLIDRAIEIVVEAHKRGALVTYGQFATTNGEIGFAAPVGPAPRREPWRATHLKTFRAGLVQRIKPEHLEQRDGAWDQAIMIPCCEMAAERAVFIPYLLYLYSVEHSFEVNATPDEKRREHAEVARIRAFEPYKRITTL